MSNFSQSVIYKYGLVGTAKVFWSDVLFGYRNGIDTFSPVAKETLFEDDRLDVHNKYIPSPFSVINHVIDAARMVIGTNFENCFLWIWQRENFNRGVASKI